VEDHLVEEDQEESQIKEEMMVMILKRMVTLSSLIDVFRTL
jgi:hypothetical protein